MTTKTKIYWILGFSLFILFILNFWFHWLVILFPNQNLSDFNLTNTFFLIVFMKNFSIETTQTLNILIIIELLSDTTQYTTENIVSNPNFIFTILNGLLLGVYLNCIGLSFSSNKRNAIMIFVCVWLIFNLFGLFGIRLILNFPFLIVKVFESNTATGCLFFIGNILYFLLIWILSLMVLTETKN